MPRDVRGSRTSPYIPERKKKINLNENSFAFNLDNGISHIVSRYLKGKTEKDTCYVKGLK